MIFIIGDEQLRRCLPLMFQRYFPETEAEKFCCGMDAWPTISRSGYDKTEVIIVTDMGFGNKMSGIDLTRMVRLNEYTAKIPVIMISGSGQHYVEEAEKAGVNMFLTLPIILEELMERLQEHFPDK